MGMFKTNKVKCDIGSYIHYWRGIKKVGKTTLFYDLVREQYDDFNKGLLIAIGDEIGYQALDGLQYAEVQTWADLLEVLTELEENKSDYEYQLIGLDTADELIRLAKEEVKRLHKKNKGTSAEFNACFGGYGAPRAKVTELVDDVLARFRRAGYGIIIIGHTKIRNIKEKNGDEYQMLSSNLDFDYDEIFANKADIVMTINVEKDIEKIDDKHNSLLDTKRLMWFRSDGFVDCGGRFKNMPMNIEYGAKNYIKAFEEGVKSSFSSQISNKEIAKRKDEEIRARNESGLKNAENVKANAIDVEKNAKYMSVITANFRDATEEQQQQIHDILNKNDIPNLKQPNEIPTAILAKVAAVFG